MADRNKESIPLSDVQKAFSQGLSEADSLRAEELNNLQTIFNAKAALLEREKLRLSKKLGSDHPRVTSLNDRIEASRVITRDLAAEVARAGIVDPGADKNTWTLHGFVRDKDSRGVANLTVALYDENGKWAKELGYACTDKNGFFKITYTAKRADAVAGTVSTASSKQKLFLIHVLNGQRRLLHVDKEPISPEPGQFDYREIYLNDEGAVCQPPESSDEETRLYPDEWVVKGQITDENDRPVGGVIVDVYDKDLIFDDYLGSTRTDEEGRYWLSYRTSDFQDLLETNPDIYIKVKDKEGRLLHTTPKPIRCEAGRVETINIRLRKK